MYTHLYLNLGNYLVFASVVTSVHLASAASWQDDNSSEEGSISGHISDESTERPEDENKIKSYVK